MNNAIKKGIWAILLIQIIAGGGYFLSDFFAKKDPIECEVIADSLFSLQHYDEAISWYSEVIAAKPNYVKAYMGRAKALIKLRRERAAIDDLSEVIKLDPVNIDAYYLRAKAIGFSNSSAKKDLDALLQFVPEYGEIYAYRGLLNFEEKSYEKAIKDFIKAVKYNYPTHDVYHYLGRAKYEMEEYTQAIQYLTQASMLKPGDFEDHRYKAYSWGKLKRPEMVMFELNAAITLKPDNTSLLYYRAQVYYYDLEDYENALADMNKLISMEPNSSNYNMRGNCFYSLKLYDSAIEDYTKAFKLDSTDVQPLISRAETHFYNKNPGAAFADFDQAIKISPNNYSIYDERARINKEFGDIEQAIWDYSKVIELNPKAEWAYNNRANIKNKIGDRAGACRDWQIAASMGSDVAQRNYDRNCR